MYSNVVSSRLASYFSAYKDGQLLGNEPALLLCEYLNSQLPPDVDEPFEDAIESFLGDKDTDELCDVNTLGGIRVTVGRVLAFAHYGRGEAFYPLTMSQLLELAKISDGTAESAPLPPWYDQVWARPASELTDALASLSFRETVKILAAQGVAVRIYDGVPTFQVGGFWFDDPREALTELLETSNEGVREVILRSL